MLTDLLNDAVRVLGDVLGPHGPAVNAAKTYAPGDFSIHFFLQLAVILLACRVVGWLGQKFLGQPQVVGEMIAGVVLGPSLFGLLFPEFQGALPQGNQERPVCRRAARRRPLHVPGRHDAASSIISSRRRRAPSACRWPVSSRRSCSRPRSRRSCSMSRAVRARITQGAATLFMGACIALTAFPMLARIINERGLANTSLGTLTLTAGAFDDAVPGACWRSCSRPSAAGRRCAVLAIGGGLGYALFMFFVRPQAAAPLGRAVEAKGEMTHSVLAVVLMLFCDVGLPDGRGRHPCGLRRLPARRGDAARAARRGDQAQDRADAVVLLLPMFFTYSGLNTRLDMVNASLAADRARHPARLDRAKFGACWARGAACWRGQSHRDGHRRADELARVDGAHHHQHRPAKGRSSARRCSR
jgi:hypothetical protein